MNEVLVSSLVFSISTDGASFHTLHRAAINQLRLQTIIANSLVHPASSSHAIIIDA